MAKAEDYARWIVANPDKKGTPEFDTVALAYQAARAQGGAPAVFAGAGATSQPRKSSMLDKATGFMANVNRGAGIGDEIAGGVRGLFRAGEAIGRGRLDQVPRAFTSAMQDQRAT
jgi:hypothetical protein